MSARQETVEPVQRDTRPEIKRHKSTKAIKSRTKAIKSRTKARIKNDMFN
jgi:hypothetical protein